MVSGQESGLHFVWQLPDGMPSAKAIQLAARAEGIGVYALSSGAAFDFNGETADDRLMLGYSSVTEKEIDQAVEKLRRVVREQGWSGLGNAYSIAADRTGSDRPSNFSG